LRVISSTTVLCLAFSQYLQECILSLIPLNLAAKVETVLRNLTDQPAFHNPYCSPTYIKQVNGAAHKYSQSNNEEMIRKVHYCSPIIGIQSINRNLIFANTNNLIIINEMIVPEAK